MKVNKMTTSELYDELVDMAIDDIKINPDSKWQEVIADLLQTDKVLLKTLQDQVADAHLEFIRAREALDEGDMSPEADKRYFKARKEWREWSALADKHPEIVPPWWKFKANNPNYYVDVD